MAWSSMPYLGSSPSPSIEDFSTETRAARSGIPGHLILNARRFRDGVQDLARTLPTLAEGLGLQFVEDRDPPA